MQTQKKQHIIQFISTVLVLIALSYLSSFYFFRLDLTSEKKYTLSEPSKNYLRSLEDPVFIQIYLDGDLPIGFKRLQKACKELLDEFRAYGKSNIQYEFINPSAEIDDKEKQRVHKDLVRRGITPVNLNVKDKEGKTSQKRIFPGAILNYGEKEFPISLLKNNPQLSAELNLNNSIQGLEYQFMQAIKQLTETQLKKIAFIEGHGEFDEYQVMDISRELAKYYQVDRGAIGGIPGVLDNYEAIVIAQPLNALNEEDKFVIDQYIMQGGKVMWLLDMVRINADSLSNAASTFGFIDQLNLEDQLFRYGVRINPSLVKDINCAAVPVNVALAGQQARFKAMRWWYYPLLLPNNESPVSRNLNMVRAEFANYIDTVGKNPDVKKEVLLHTSKFTQDVTAPIMVSLNEMDEQPDPLLYNRSFLPVAVALEGNFTSNYKNRSLDRFRKKGDFQFQEKSKKTRMIVIADGDIIKNDVKYNGRQPVPQPMGVDAYTKETYGNKEFILNAINYLTDTDGLMHLRSREIKLRLLNKSKIFKEKGKWQFINLGLPVVLVILSGILIYYIRKRKYTK